MDLPERDDVVEWVGRTVVDVEGAAVGPCRHVYADEATGLPEWLVAELSDGRTAFVPLTDATSTGSEVRVPFTREKITTAPGFGDSGHLEPEQEIRLYDHYAVPYSREASETVLPTAGPQDGTDAAADRRLHPVGGDAATPDAGLAPPLVPVTVPDVPPPAPPAPLVVAPEPVTPPTRAPAAKGAAARSAAAQPAVLGGLAGAVALVAAARALQGRRRKSRPKTALEQVKARAAALAKASAETRRDLAQVGAVQARELARVSAAKRKELAKTSAARRKDLVKTKAVVAQTGAAKGRDLAATATELAKAAAARRDQLVQLGSEQSAALAAKRKDLAKAGASKRKDVGKAGASRRKDVAKASASTRKDLAKASTRKRKDLAKAGASTRAELVKARDARRKDAAKAARRKDLAKAGARTRGTLSSYGTHASRSLTRAGRPSVTSDVSRGATRRTKKVKRSWRKAGRRLSLGLGLASGYVVGARAGRQRYDQIVQAAGPQVQQVRQRLVVLTRRSSAS